MKRTWFLATILVPACALLLTLGCAGGPKSTKHLRTVPGFGRGRAYKVGEFQIQWRPDRDGSLSIRHLSEPNRIIWETPKGKSFLEAGVGKAQVAESQGSFTGKDPWLRTFDQQEVQRISRTRKGIEIVGRLFAKKGAIPFRITFEALSPNRLRFVAEVPERTANRLRLTYTKEKGERFFWFGQHSGQDDGLGERLPVLVRERGIGRGVRRRTLGADPPAAADGGWHSAYAAAPQYVTTSLRSLFLENDEYAIFDFRARRSVSIEVFSSEIRGQIVYGNTPTELISAFTTAFRSRGDNDPEANVQIDLSPATEEAFAKTAKLDAALGPYRKTLIAEAAETGLPVARHPWIHYPDDRTFWDFTYAQFMLGPKIMVAPVPDQSRKRVKVYLPQGIWEDMWTGERSVVDEKGLWIKVAGPVGQPAAFWLDKGDAEFASAMRAIRQRSP